MKRSQMLVTMAAVAVVAGFIFFMRQADELAPATHDMRIELPDAFKQ